MKMVIPKVWNYLLTFFLRIFFLSVLGLCLILFVARFQDIARFSSAVGSLQLTSKYILFQIPYLLPFAMLLASVFSAYYVGKAISQSHELTAIRMGGMSLFSIFTPIRYTLFVLACMTSLLSFSYLPYSKARIAKLISEVNTQNPFLFLRNSQFNSNKKMHIVYEDGQSSETLQNVLCGIFNEKTKSIDLILASSISLNESELQAKDATLISANETQTYIENIDSLAMQIDSFSDWAANNSANLSPECIPLSNQFKDFVKNPSTASPFLFLFGQALFFPVTLLFLSQVALFTSFSVSRSRTWKAALPLMIATLLTFSGYITGKTLAARPAIACTCFLLPLCTLPLFIWGIRNRIEKGLAL